MEKTNFKFEYLEETYENLCPLGNDRVYLVRRRDDGRIFVKKYIPKESVAVYERLLTVQNRYLERVYACAAGDARGLVITGFISGETMRACLDRYGTIPKANALLYGTQVLYALEELHAHNIIHRDINPNNVMLTEDGEIKLIDYGIAREMKPDSGRDTQILGTVGYAPPEQFGFRQTDARTDLYAAGVLLNEMLTGNLPQERLYLGDGTVTAVIEKATRLEAQNRYQTAEQMLAALSPEAQEPEQKRGWLPGFRSHVKWKEGVAAVIYTLLVIFSVGAVTDAAKTPETAGLEFLAVLLYAWAMAFAAGGAWDWDKKVPLLRRLPYGARIAIRVIAAFLLFYWGILLDNHVHLDLLGETPTNP